MKRQRLARVLSQRKVKLEGERIYISGNTLAQVYFGSGLNETDSADEQRVV